jgi:hypothetical protein
LEKNNNQPSPQLAKDFFEIAHYHNYQKEHVTSLSFTYDDG